MVFIPIDDNKEDEEAEDDDYTDEEFYKVKENQKMLQYKQYIKLETQKMQQKKHYQNQKKKLLNL